jgi:hypothetical protein
LQTEALLLALPTEDTHRVPLHALNARMDAAKAALGINWQYSAIGGRA